MKNKKIIFLVATVCCLAVCWLCFGAWTIADTSYQLSDFQYSTSIAYLYIVPSSNIPSTEYANIQVSGVYTNPGSSSTVQTSAFAGTLSSFSSSITGLYVKSSTAFSSNRAVRLDVGISAIDTSIGAYVITGSYIVDSTPSLVASPSYRVFSNYSYAQIGSSQYRTLILFIDKLPSGGVSQEEYDDVVDQLEQAELLNDQLYNDNLTLQEDLNALQVNYNQVSQRFAEVEQLYSNLQGQFTTLQGLYDQAVIDRDMWESYAQGIEEQLDELYFSNQQLQRDYDNLLREYNIIVSENQSIGFVERAFLAVGNILEIEILPNITIGTIVAVPLILGVVFLVLRLVRGE